MRMAVTHSDSTTVANSPAKVIGTGASRTSTRWEIVAFGLAHGVVAILLRCLSLRGLYRFCTAFGTIEWLINYKRRKRYGKELARVLGRKPSSQERRNHTRKYFQRQRCDKVFYLVFDCIPRDVARTLLTIEPKNLMDEAMSDGLGVYMAMSHFGAQHVAGMLLAVQGYKVVGVRDRNEGGLRRYVINRFDKKYPELSRLRVLFSDSYPRDIYRCFKEGYIVGSSMDVSRTRHQNQQVEEISVFGEKRQYVTGPLRVAMRCGSKVLQAFVIPMSDFRYRLEISGGLVDKGAEESEEAVSHAMATYATTAERYACEYPELLTRI